MTAGVEIDDDLVWTGVQKIETSIGRLYDFFPVSSPIPARKYINIYIYIQLDYDNEIGLWKYIVTFLLKHQVYKLEL